MEVSPSRYIVDFDLTSLQDLAKQFHYPELSEESMRVQIFFNFHLEQVTEMLVLGEDYQMFIVTNPEQSLKLLFFF